MISNTAVKLRSSSLLMTYRVLVTSANGSSVEARALLENGSSASFITERLAQGLSLPHVHQNVHVSGITGSSPKSPIQSIASLQISPAHYNGRKIDLTAIVVPRTSLFTRPHLICPGTTLLVSPWQIQPLDNQVASISFLE